jgi:2-(3-amino-3-carboxypropyl)histidine synthase
MDSTAPPAPARNSAAGVVPKVIRRGKKNTIPDSIALNAALLEAIKNLPENYNFEILKTVWRIKTEGAKLVALQFPEGLLMYALIISDIIEAFCESKVMILSDVTYGACCIDDLTAHKLGADFLVHYGHSCLVPSSTTVIKTLYVFVEIVFECSHLVNCVKKNFTLESKIALMGTIQFNSAIHEVSTLLQAEGYQLYVPQEKPLSSGETLGCTAPLLPAQKCDSLVFVADGRFHLEAAMIRNPQLKAFRYDPYSKILSIETYDTAKMKHDRWNAIERARPCKNYGIILGTLGRQGNTILFERMKKKAEAKGKNIFLFLMAELNPSKLALFDFIDVWVQVACPRLSIDWGLGFTKPLLTPYELLVSLGEAPWEEVYPMDYYGSSGSEWSNGRK